jgi:drug/metabolite transporter (DMT)-like permease
VFRPSTLLFIACVAIWSTNWIAITTQIHATPAVTALFWRFLLASLTLFLVARWRGLPMRPRVPLVPSAAVGAAYYFAGIGVTYLAARHLASSYVACLSVTTVFFSMAIKRVCYRTPLAASNVVGAAISACGLALFFLEGRAAGTASLVGLGLGLIAFLCVSVGAVISEYLQKKYKASSLEINRDAIATAAILYLAVALATRTPLDVPLTGGYLLPLVYLGVICSALVFVLYIALIGQIGAEYAGYVTFVYPLAATYVSAAAGETQLRVSMIAGSVLVAAGCVIGLKYAGFASARAKEVTP